MTAPTLWEFLKDGGLTVFDHMAMPVEPETFCTGLATRMCAPTRSDSRRSNDDGHSLAGSSIEDLAATLKAAGMDTTIDDAMDADGRPLKRMQARFADVHARIETGRGHDRLKLADIRFGCPDAMIHATNGRSAIAKRLGLEHLDRKLTKAPIHSICGGEPGWAMLQDAMLDIAGETHDFAVDGEEAPANLLIGRGSSSWRGSAVAIAMHADGRRMADQKRRSRGLRAATHALALFDPFGELKFKIPTTSGSSILDAARRLPHARQERVARFLEASGASAGLVREWERGGAAMDTGIAP